MTPDVFAEFKHVSERIDALDAKLDEILKAVTEEVPEAPVASSTLETVTPEVPAVAPEADVNQATPEVAPVASDTESVSEDAGENESSETADPGTSTEASNVQTSTPASETESASEDASEQGEEPTVTDASGNPVTDPNAAR